jgi:hypothetical protein
VPFEHINTMIDGLDALNWASNSEPDRRSVSIYGTIPVMNHTTMLIYV